MPTRDLSNKRVTIWLGLANAVANLAAPTAAEINAMRNISPAIRWDGFDFGSQESEQTDDRSLDDDAGSVIRGFAQFGGAVPLFWPKATDTTSILRQAYNMLKVDRAELIVVERVGWKGTNELAAAGDVVNTYRVMADGFNPDTEGTGGYAYISNWLPKGDVNPWTIVAAATPAAVAITGAATQALSLAGVSVALRAATYQGNDVTNRAIWTSSNAAVAEVRGGVIVGRTAGTATVTAIFPGGTASTAVTVTVAA